MKLINILTILIILSCSIEPEKINLGMDLCKNCMMTISDAKYASLIFTKKYKSYKFDSIECMADYVNKKNIENNLISDLYVADLSSNGKMIKIQMARFIRSEKYKSPMGMNLIAINKDSADDDTIRWIDVKRLVKENWNN